jgi:asparagine synthase (glutamine-hydrolysing)
MCGVAGQVRPGGDPVDPALLERMCAAIEHRGPDALGIHRDEHVGLGIRRLRVIDLETGDQPIYNEDRSVVVVLNGEIYNHRELRSELQARGHVFATKGDTEVIVHLYEERGVDCVRDLHGMFAFALWDARRQQLLLARDRVGKKPLVYATACCRSRPSWRRCCRTSRSRARSIPWRSTATSPTATSRRR